MAKQTTQPKPANGGTAIATANESRSVSYVPLGEAEAIEVSMGMVRNTIATKSKRGATPGDSEIIRFMMLCKSRSLNPFVGDAYLLGYDENDGRTTWTLITAIQALRKRAEGHPKFNGCRRGVIVKRDGKVVEIEGSFYQESDVLLGGWAECVRRENDIPFRETVKLAVYDKGYSRWKADPGGMICKVAEAAALRRAFPSDLAGLYVREEFNDDLRVTGPEQPRNGMAGLRSALGAPQPQTDALPHAETAGDRYEPIPDERPTVPVSDAPTEQELIAAGINEGPRGEKLFGDTSPHANEA